jgi:hypothetical protein
MRWTYWSRVPGRQALALAAACARLGLSTALADPGHVRALGRRTARTARRAIGAAPAKTLAIGTTACAAGT